MYRFFAPLLVSLASAVLVACSPASSTRPAAGPPGASASSAAQAVAVQGTDALKFEPSSITVKAGQHVTLTLSNTGQTVHDWSLTQGVAQPVKISAAGGALAAGTFTIDRPGTYTFTCSQPGHEAGGMKGTLTAQ
jgi:plastocyanin